jgi:lipopolysaccharide export LptBFGC system permease protein LptF
MQQGEIWLRTPDAAFVHIELVDSGAEHLHGITIYRKHRQGDLIEQVEAREAVWHANHWTLLQGTISRFRENLTTDIEPFARLVTPIGVEPEALRAMFRPPSHMSLSALRAYMRKLRDRGVDMSAYARDFQLKLATPAMGIIMTLVALAGMWGAHGARHISLGFAGTLGGGAIYWLLVLAGTTFSEGQLIALLIGIWLPHLVILGAASGILWYKMRL